MSCCILFSRPPASVSLKCFRFYPSFPTRRRCAPGLHQRSLSTPPTPTESVYVGPLASTFRRLKIFSLSSLTLSCTLTPFMFLMESNLPTTARLALASIAVGTSGISTGLVGWCGKPYVAKFRRLVSEKNGGVQGIEMSTFDLLLRTRITRVYDATFLIESKRPFAKWELADKMVLPDTKSSIPGHEETVAETTDKDGNTIGRWVVKWGENGEGICREVGSVIRHFNIHEELLS